MPLSRFSIKHQLLLIVAIIALPAIAIIVTSGIQQRRTAIHDAKLETQKLAEAIVSEQKNLVASSRQLFIALAQLSEVTSRKKAETEAILSEILRLSPQYSSLFIADSSGKIWASALPLTKAISVADRRYFKNALASGNLSSGEYHIARTSNKPTLNLGFPLKDRNGQVTAVICAGLSLDYYRHIFDTYNLPEGASFSLLDHQGIILTRAVEAEKYIGMPSNPEIFRHMEAGPEEETSIGTSSVAGDNRIQTYRKIRLAGEATPYIYVRAGIPTATVMSAANASLRRNLLIYSLGLIVAAFLSWLIGKKYIINRILLLQRSSHRLAEGDLETRVAPAVAGGELGDLGMAFDHMAQRLAVREQALRESKENYREIFNTTHDALLVSDLSGKITEANRAGEIIFGYRREELLQLSTRDLISGAPPSSYAQALPLMEKAFAKGTQEFECLCRRKDGKSFWTEMAMTPTSVVGERRILTVIRDISERKEMEVMKESLLSSISHEMRTPLTAMLGFLEFVIDNKVEEAQLRDYHIIMYKEGERLNEIISNFLDMQRLKAKLHEYHFQPLEVRKFCAEAVAIFASPSAKHAIIVSVPAELPLLQGDEELLHQALRNLLSNALKYSKEGSEITLEARQEGERVILAIRDQGMGIPPEGLEKIFEMFYRVEGKSSRQIIGTGLGLALVREIAAVHQGQVWVESTLGLGSTFYLSLPIAGEGQGKEAAP